MKRLRSNEAPPRLTQEQAIKEFYDVLLPDPDPASLDIAQDLCEAYGLKLAQLGHEMALHGFENLVDKNTKGWAEDFSRRENSTGQFVFSETRDPFRIEMRPPRKNERGWWVPKEMRSEQALADAMSPGGRAGPRIDDIGWVAPRDISAAPDENGLVAVTLVPNPEYMAVGWMVWKYGFRGRGQPSGFVVDVWVAYGGTSWDEVSPRKRGDVYKAGGVLGPVLEDLKQRGDDYYAAVRQMRSLFLVEGGSTLKVAERRAVETVWQIGKVLKSMYLAGSDPLDVLIRLHDDLGLEWSEYAPPPKSIVNPAGTKQAARELAGGLWNLATELNPPRTFRPQKVVAKLQRETRPEFQKRTIGAPEDVALALSDYIGDRASESFVVLFINIRNQLVGYTELTELSIAEVSVNTAGIFREALAAGAAGLVTAHNHPTGDPEPSAADHGLWERLREIGKLLGVPVVDNMVIGEQRYYSQAQDGYGRIPSSAREPR